MRNPLRIMLVALVLFGRPMCPAAEPLPLAQAMQERSALGKALTNQFARSGEEASAEGSPIALELAATLLVAAAIAAHRLSPRLKRRFRSWNPKPVEPADLASRLLEEPSIRAFFEALKAGPAELPAGTATMPELLQEFYDSARRPLAELRKLFSEVSHALDEPARRTKLLEFYQQVGALRERARLPELRPVRQLALGLEGLLKHLSNQAVNVTPSMLRTTLGALDLLGDLCSRPSRPDLITEPPIRLLAVDDDPISRHAVSLALAKAFNKPDLAPEGQTALELAGRQTYDAIFLDVQMPGMDGFELCSRLRATELNRATPVVFVTCQDDFASRARVTVVGAQDLISKPFYVLEIAVKALTVVMRARLGDIALEPASADQPEAASTAAAALASTAKATSGAVTPRGQPCLSAGRGQTPPRGSLANNILGGAALLSPLPSSSTAASALRDLSPGGLSMPAPPSRQTVANAFFTQAPAQIEKLRQQLAVAGDARPDGLHPLLGDVYLDAHKLCSDAGRAQLSAALRLASALEAMLKKLFERPNLCTASTLDAAAGALDVLDELCRARTDPDLARPAVRLLVADDDPVARRAITMALQLMFGRPDSAESGEAALALAGKREFDLIFLDVSMPGMDGFAACSQIHETAMNRITPVVFITNHGDRASRAQAADAGGCGFISKPVLSSQIALVALSYILHGRLARQLPELETPSFLAGSGLEPAFPEFAGATAVDHSPQQYPPGSVRRDCDMPIMKPLKTLTWLAALALGVTRQAGAGLYYITFNDGNGNVGSGQIDVQLANGNYYADNGYLIVSSGQAIGDWNLYTARGSTQYPGYIYSPSGAFIYNNAVYPTGNPQYPAANPLLDYYGLLFTQSNNNELNLWGNADGTYTLGGNIGGWQNFNVTISFGETTIEPVPEPINYALAGFGLIFACGSAVHFYVSQRRSKAGR